MKSKIIELIKFYSWVMYILLYLCLGYATYQGWTSIEQYLVSKNEASLNKQYEKLKKEINALASSKNIDKKRVLTLSMLASPSQIAQSVREALLNRRGITLISLTQKPVETQPIKNYLSQVHTSRKSLKLVKYEYHLQLLATYKPFVNVLKEMSSMKGVYWQSVKYEVKKYPQAVVEIKFYSLSRE